MQEGDTKRSNHSDERWKNLQLNKTKLVCHCQSRDEKNWPTKKKKRNSTQLSSQSGLKLFSDFLLNIVIFANVFVIQYIHTYVYAYVHVFIYVCMYVHVYVVMIEDERTKYTKTKKTCRERVEI